MSLVVLTAMSGCTGKNANQRNVSRRYGFPIRLDARNCTHFAIDQARQII